jgi:hypothetical protein
MEILRRDYTQFGLRCELATRQFSIECGTTVDSYEILGKGCGLAT